MSEKGTAAMLVNWTTAGKIDDPRRIRAVRREKNGKVWYDRLPRPTTGGVKHPWDAKRRAAFKPVKAPKGLGRPTIQQPESLARLIELKERDPDYSTANILLFAGAGSRNFTGKISYARIRLSVPLSTPRFGQMSYLTDTLYGENSGMVNDWTGADAAISSLLADHEFNRLVEAVYGADYGLARDRGHYRLGDPAIDLSAGGLKKLVANAHTDQYNAATEGFKDFKQPTTPDAMRAMTRTVAWEQGELCVVLLSQGTLHSIGQGGMTGSGQPVLGWFLGALAAPVFSGYLRETWKRFEQQIVARVRKGLSAYVWSGLEPILDVYASDHLTGARVVVCATVCYGLPPMVYPSRKKVDVPQPYAPAPYKPFDERGGMRPNPAHMAYEPAEQLGELHPDIRPYFEAVARLVTGNWTRYIPALSDEFLFRILGLTPP